MGWGQTAPSDMASAPGLRWDDDDWRKRRLMDWLLAPAHEREPHSRTGLAQLLSVDVRTLRNWQDEPRFREEWDRRVAKVIGDPERAQEVIDTLYLAATDPRNRNHVQAAKLFLEATNAIKPPPIEVTVKRPVDLTDAELDELLAQGAAQLKAEQREAADATD